MALTLGLVSALVFGAASVLAVVNDGGDLDVEVADNSTSEADLTDEGGLVQYLGDDDTTFGAAGTGTFNSFLRVQADGSESGYNTDGTLQFDSKAGAWTHAIKVSEIPVVLDPVEADPGLYWELFADINDGNSTPKISLDELEIWFTEDENLTGYTVPNGFASDATKVYDFDGTVRINDVNQGSGRGDLRFYVPLADIDIPAGCDYGDAGCATYFVLYTKWGGAGGDYESDGGFEEWKVKLYPTIKIEKIAQGGDDTFGYTVTGPSAPSGVSITTSGGAGETVTYIVEPGDFTIDESTIPAGWTEQGAVCSLNGATPTAYAGGAITLDEDDHLVCTFTNQILTSSITTTLHDASHGTITEGSSVALGSVVHDSATVTANIGTPLGSVTFRFYTSQSACTADTTFSAGVTKGTVALSGGVAHPSTDTGVLAAGSYAFKAQYVSSNGYPTATSACEPFTVSKATPTLATTLHRTSDDGTVANGASVPLGTVMHDSAQLGSLVNAVDPTGNVTFTFFANGTCTPAGSAAGTVAVTAAGLAHPSNDTAALAAGSYSFQASYPGDANYEAANSACEPFTVSKAQLTVTTAVHDAQHVDRTNGSVPLGSVMHDTATLSGVVQGFTPPAITFTFYTDGSCAGDGTAVANTGADGGAVRSADSAALAAGSYAYKGAVEDDDNYLGDGSDCEPFTVDRAPTTIATELHTAGESVIAVGGEAPAGNTLPTIHDKATVSGTVGSFVIDGNVAFRFFGNGTCTGDPLTGPTNVALSGGVAHPSFSSGPLSAGTYGYQAQYLGNANYEASEWSACENFTVTTLTIVKNARGGNGTFGYTVTGPSGSTPGITTTGSPNGTGQVVLVVLAGNYTVGETTIPSGWTLTGLDCPGTDPVGGTTSNTFAIPAGTNATCTFENTASLTTRTQGFWATHRTLTEAVWNGGSIGGHTFTGVVDKTLCGETLDSAKVLGAFWASIPREDATGDRRDSQDQAKMRLLQQLMAAILNNAAFGSAPTTVTIDQAKAIFCDDSATITQINNAASAMAAFNESGDSGLFTPGVSANGKDAKDNADVDYWNDTHVP